VVYQQTRSDYYTNLAKKMANSRSFLNDMDEDLGKVTQWTNNMRTTGQITGVTEQQILENVSVVRETTVARWSGSCQEAAGCQNPHNLG
jgi:hypothetical protein